MSAFVFSERGKELIACCLIFVLVLVLFREVIFQNKSFVVPDSKSPAALTAPMSELLNNDGIYPLWHPYIFSGMPSFASLIYNPYVYVLGALMSIFNFVLPPLSWLWIHYFLAGFFTFILMRSKKISISGALLSAVTFMFTPFLVAMGTFGHGSQMMTAAYIPLAFWAVDRLLEKRSILYIALTALALGLQLQRGHVQIAYYTWMMVGLYFVYFSYLRLRSGASATDVLKTGGLLAIALVWAFALASVLYLPVYNYTPYSIRGGGSEGGVGFEYATGWSFHPKEMLTYLVPSFFGFGGSTYWGKMPFTDFPNYMGLIPLFLAILALIWRRNKTTVFFGILIFVSLLASFGRHFLFYQFLYDFLPFFKKFRVPVMILILVQFSVAAMAGYGLDNLIRFSREKMEKTTSEKIKRLTKRLAIAIGILIAAGLILSLGKKSFFGTMSEIYPQSARYTTLELNQMRFDMFYKDTWKMIFLFAIGGGITIGLLKRYVRPHLFGISLLFLTAADLWLVDFKLVRPSGRGEMNRYLAQDETIEFIKRDEDIFRIFPVGRLFSDNKWAAHRIFSIGGYHAAKLKIYQEFLSKQGIPKEFLSKYLKPSRATKQGYVLKDIDEVSLKDRRAHSAALDMLNVKYVVSPYPIPDPQYKLVAQKKGYIDGHETSLNIYQKQSVLPRTFLVGKVKVVPDENKILDEMRSGAFDPHEYALLEEVPEFEPESVESSFARITDYGIHNIKLQASNLKPCLLVLSEIYYPEGWKAYLNGEEVKIYKTNYLLRSILLPPGDHRIEFVFDPWDFKLGLWISVGAWALLIGLLSLKGVRYYRAERGQK